MELTASQGGGDDKTKRAVENLSEKVEELQSQLLSALSNQSTYAATSAAIKGPIGDSIAKLELSSASRQLGEVNARLKEIQTQVGDVKNDTTAIKQDIKVVQATLSGVAKEVSDDPRKELVKRGYTVDGRGLEKAMLEKDFVALKHFNNSGYVPRYPKFPEFLFLEGWDPAVFNALSPTILGLPNSCEDWPLRYIFDSYEFLSIPEFKEILQNQVRVCGREHMVDKLRKKLEFVLSDPFGEERELADRKAKIASLRGSINPKKKKPVLIHGTSMYLECNSRVEKCEYGISPEDFAEEEKYYLDSLAKWEAKRKKWPAEFNRTIEAVKKM
jgi:prefoldin subunit 5